MSLVPRFVYGDLDLTDYPFAVEFGSDFGNPENVVDVVQTLLHDGEVLESNRRTNRTLTIPVLIECADMQELADSEALLIAECDRSRNSLSVEPGDGVGATTVFETFRAQPRWNRDDDEERSNVRRFVLEIPALPHTFSVDPITDDAGTPPSTGGTLLYNFESTSGWARVGYAPYAAEYAVDGTVYSEGAGSIRSHATLYQTSFYSYGDGWNVASRSNDGVSGLSLSTGAGGYLSVRARFEWIQTNLTFYVTTSTGGRERVVDPMATEIDVAGFTRYVWPVDGGLTITGLDVEWGQRGPSISGNRGHFWIDDLELLPAATTDHQIVKQLTVEGSARTTGSLHIAAATDVVALGKVLAITAPTDELPDGFQPDGRRWVVQGDTTVDASALWGSYYTPDPADYSDDTGTPDRPVFDVPVGMLTPGPYSIVALVKADGVTDTLAGVQAQLRYSTTDTGPVSAAEITVPAANLAAGWHFVTVGTVYLPPLPMQSADTSAKVRLLFKGAKLADVYMIPAWQVGGRSVADFSIVDCGTGTPAAGGSSSSLWIDSPSTSQPRGGWWRGPTADRVNAQSAWPDAKKPGLHAFKPGRLSAFLVSTGAAGPTLELTYVPAWFGNAAK